MCTPVELSGTTPETVMLFATGCESGDTVMDTVPGVRGQSLRR